MSASDGQGAPPPVGAPPARGADGFFGALRSLSRAPTRNPGYTAPPTDDINTGEAVFDTSRQRNRYGDPGGVQRGLMRLGRGGPARRDEPNDFEWLLQHRMEIRGVCETTLCVSVDDPGTVVQLRPECASRYVVVANADCSLVLNSLAGGVPENPDDPEAPLRRQTISFVLTIMRAAGVEVTLPAGVLWSQEYLDAEWVPTGVDADSLNSPHSSPTDPYIERYVFDWTPGIASPGAWLGERIGRNYQSA